MTNLLLAWSARWGAAAGVLVVAVLGGWLAKSVFFRRLRALAAHTATRADDVLLDATRPYWVVAALLLGALPALRLSPLPPDARLTIERFDFAALLVVITLAAARYVTLWFAPSPGSPHAVHTSLVRNAVRALVFVAGFLLVLDNAGVEIKTLLTALGVGSLAVGLALQPTLSNLFAGIHLSMAQPIRVGDFVELEDGTQGHVVDVGWRATRIRQLSNNLVVVPNARLAEMRLLNYSLPDPPQAVLVPVGVSYASDLRRVEAVTVEVARGLQRELPQADPQHEPFIRYSEFGDSAINFTAILRARSYTERWTVIHEFVMRLKECYDREGIEIPFPQRVVHAPPPPRRPEEP